MALLYLLGLGNFGVGVGAFAVIGVLGPITRDFALSPIGASWIMTSYAIAYALGSPTLTALSGRFTRRDVLAFGMGLFALGVLGCALAPSPMALYAARIVAALGAGLFSPGAAAVGVALVGPERRGEALSVVFGGITLAQVVGVPAGSYLGYTLGWPAVFWIIGALAVAMTAVIHRALPANVQTTPTGLADLLATLRDPALGAAVTLTATAMGAGWVAFTFLAPIIETKIPGGAGATTALLLAAYGLGSVLGNMASGRLVDRIGPVKAIVAVLAAQVPVTFALTVVPWGGVIGGALLLVAWGAVGWAYMVPQQARLVALDPKRTPVLLALNAACIYVGASFGSTLGGLTKAAYGLEALGPVGALAVLAALAHLALSLRLSARRAAAQPAKGR